MLGRYDDLSVKSSQGYIFDYIAWGADPGTDDTIAVYLSVWTNSNYVNTSDLLNNETIGRDKKSTDLNNTADWENPSTNKADPYGIHTATVTVGAINLDTWIVINEILFDPIGGAYDFNWDYRKKITIHSSKVTADLTDFSVLISITDSDLQSKAQSDGDDILFTTLNGETKLDHEIESYNSTTGELIAWIRIPSLSSTTETEIYMYYGNSDSADQSNPTGVWNNNYRGVWHLKEYPDGTADEIKDSTSYSNDGTSVGSMDSNDQVDGKIDGSLEFDGSDDYINIGDQSSLDMGTSDLTIEAWIDVSTSPAQSYPTILSKGGGSAGEAGYWFYWYDSNNYLRFTIGDGSSRIEVNSVSSVKDGSWHHVVAVADRDGNGMIYIDGELDNSADFSSKDGQSIDTASFFYISDSGSLVWEDGLDEVRISNTVRSWDWINASYNNQNSPSTFITSGTEEATDNLGSRNIANNEWVELYNAGNYTVDLTGWYLTDNDGLKFDISGAGSIPPGGYLVCHLGQGGTNSSSDVYGYIDYESEFEIQPGASAGKDVYLDSSLGISNTGTWTTMTVTNASSLYIRPMVQFDLSSLPPGNIKDAKVWLYRSGGHATTSATVNLHRVTQTWIEGDGSVLSGANWPSYDGTNSWPVNTNGGDFDTSIEDTKTVVAGTNAWYYWDVTDLVGEWESGTYINYGMIFQADDGSEYQYLVSSDNSDSSKHPKLIVNMTTTAPMLGNSDDISLMDSNSIIIDYVAWGADPAADDDDAVSWGQWTDGEYVDTSDLLKNQTIGRDKDSNDTNLPANWENGSGKADPFGIDRSTENGSTPHAQNIDFVIPEFEEIVIPIVFMVLTLTIWRRKKRYKSLPKEPPRQKENGSSQDCLNRK